ncbi:MAG: N-acetylmuramoyl-L-alanine amidase [Clostridiales bacterium]|nr:N-acetylmuramoyl-L-alanine amidase [Clostridiales bacterium]HOA85410.1 N-acetylmuramoyl-L-alanine amidase [Bacillota bacterium]
MAIKIYIDQAHNPVNPNAGAEAFGLREQDLVFRIGVELAALLAADENFEVRLSRPTPATQLGTSTATSLQARVSDANSWGANYFISLHANASMISSASGSEAYVYSRQSEAYPFAERILIWLNRATGLQNRGVFVRPGLYVLRRTAMPAVLLELGFITNYNDANLMNTRPDLFAQGIYYGILDYFGLLQ